MTDDTADEPVTREEFEELRDALNELERDYQNTRKYKLEPKLEEAHEEISALRERNAALQEQLDAAHRKIDNLESEFESLAGLAEDQQSSPAKRAADLRQGMIRRAEAKDDKNSEKIEAKVALYYKEVQELLADLGHGKIYKQQAFDAMEDAAEADGFELTTKLSDRGNQVKAVKLDLAALPGYTPGNEITTAETPASTADETISAVNATQD